MNPATLTGHPSAPPIVSIGDLVADLVVSIPSLPVQAGQHQVARQIQLEPGGGANFLIAGARLGQPMAAIGVLGDDTWGHQVAAMVRAEGVDISGVRHNGSTTLVVVLVDQSGRHVFLGTYGRGSPVEPRPIDATLIQSSSAVYVAGYTLREERLLNLTMSALQLARQHNRPVFFDPGPHINGVPPALQQEVLAQVDTLLLTEEEIPLLAAGSVGGLIKAGPKQVVVKRGASGCAVYTAAGCNPVLEAPGYPVAVVDTAAAGDSFNAAFIAATVWGWPLAQRAKLANAVGAAKVKKLGSGRNVPTLPEVQAVLDEFENSSLQKD